MSPSCWSNAAPNERGNDNGTDPENTLVMELKTGPVVIALKPDLAPEHVARIKELARAGLL